jgi:hypothetical protein
MQLLGYRHVIATLWTIADPPAPQVDRLSWKGRDTVVRVGWEWALLGFDAARVPAVTAPRNAEQPMMVVSMGGSDPLDLTRLAARALAKITVPFRVRFIIGPGFRTARAIAREVESLSPNFQAVHGIDDLGQELAAADWFGQDCIKRTTLDLFVNKPDTHKNRNESSEQQHRAEPQIYDNLCFLSGGEFAEEDGPGNQQQNKKHQIVEHAIAHRFAKSVAGNSQRSANARPDR